MVSCPLHDLSILRFISLNEMSLADLLDLLSIKSSQNPKAEGVTSAGSPPAVFHPGVPGALPQWPPPFHNPWEFPSLGRRCPYPERLGTCILHSSEGVLDRVTLNQGHRLTCLDPLGSSPAPSPAGHQNHLPCHSRGWRREVLSGSPESVVSWD